MPRQQQQLVPFYDTDISDQSLNDATDESYVLRVDAPVSFIQARTVFGALHALETFSQMVDRVDYKDLPVADRLRVLPYFHGFHQADSGAEDHAADAPSSADGDQVDAAAAAVRSARRLHLTDNAGVTDDKRMILTKHGAIDSVH